MPLTVLDRLNIVPFGWVSCADTISKESSVSNMFGFISTVQTKVMLDPTVQIVLLLGSVVTVTDDGGGTVIV